MFSIVCLSLNTRCHLINVLKATSKWSTLSLHWSPLMMMYMSLLIVTADYPQDLRGRSWRMARGATSHLTSCDALVGGATEYLSTLSNSSQKSLTNLCSCLFPPLTSFTKRHHLDICLIKNSFSPTLEMTRWKELILLVTILSFTIFLEEAMLRCRCRRTNHRQVFSTMMTFSSSRKSSWAP